MKISACRVLTPAGWVPDHTVHITDGVISAVTPVSQAERSTVLQGSLVPGFFDTQVNGGGGVLFNQRPSPETILTMATAHLQFGTTSMLPTLITDNAGVMEAAADAVCEVVKQAHPLVPGIHFEGPFLSNAKKGVHSAEYIRQPTDREMAILCRQDLGKVLVTVAPEGIDTGLIRELVNEGVVVALGHTNATFDETQEALAAGASGFTHLYNAMSAMTSRAPGVVGAALDSQESFCGLIVDHHHVHPASARVAIRAKGTQRIMLVTDAMAHVGSDMVTMPFFGGEIVREGSRLTTPEGTLAGSCLDMLGAVRNSHRDLGIALDETISMAAHNPAVFMGLADKIGRIDTGHTANLLLLEDDTLEIKARWLAGRELSELAGVGQV